MNSWHWNQWKLLATTERWQMGTTVDDRSSYSRAESRMACVVVIKMALIFHYDYYTYSLDIWWLAKSITVKVFWTTLCTLFDKASKALTDPIVLYWNSKSVLKVWSISYWYAQICIFTHNIYFNFYYQYPSTYKVQFLCFNPYGIPFFESSNIYDYGFQP